MTQKFEAFIGLCVISLTIAFLVTLSQANSFSLTTKSYPIKANFSNISGITVGSDVKMSGVKIGTVSQTHLNPHDYRAELILNIQENIKLPTDSVIKIASDSLLGGASINIEAGFEETFLQPNDNLQNTQSSVSIMELISKAIFSAGAN